MNVWMVSFLTLIIGITACTKSPAPAVNNPQPPPISSPTAAVVTDLTHLDENDWYEHRGKVDMARGKFSMRGIVGPFIHIDDGLIYLKSDGNYSWGKEFERMEGKDVRVTGTLEFRHYEASPGQHPPDYFYFRAETAKIELIK
ncbi:MAG TPA: hypothetical protein VIU65_10890 [Pyrinomonadaceae bacterium]